MKKTVFILFLVSIFQNSVVAQDSHLLDSLRHELTNATHDTTRMIVLIDLSSSLRFNRPDSAIYYANKGLILSRKFNKPELELDAMINIQQSYITLGNESSALKVNLEAKKLIEINSLTRQKIEVPAQSALIYRMSNNYAKALNSNRTVISLADSTNTRFWKIVGRSFLALTFLDMNQIDSALFYGHLSYEFAQKFNIGITYPEHALGKIYFEKGDHELALKYLHESLLSVSATNTRLTFERLFMIAQVYHHIGVSDSSIYYGNRALNISLENSLYSSIIEAHILLSKIYENLDLEKVLQYSKLAMAYRDTLDMLRKNATLDAFISFDEQERQFELEKARREFQNRLRRNAFFGSTFTLVVIAILLFILFKRKQKAKQKIEQAYDNLKSTQAQLIQSEKMASLGELTAGIAHEIQNPLNFVNNFSEVNAELIDEAEAEIQKGNIDETRSLLKDIKENENKILQHGKRADAIVKGMLQHSRISNGQKELTDINALADEYLRLAFHGFRAKDKSFNADLKTEFDENYQKLMSYLRISAEYS